MRSGQSELLVVFSAGVLNETVISPWVIVILGYCRCVLLPEHVSFALGPASSEKKPMQFQKTQLLVRTLHILCFVRLDLVFSNPKTHLSMLRRKRSMSYIA